jgi:hypothetical protein
VAVDGAVVDIDLVVVGRVHQVVAALHKSRPLGQRLQEQELGDGQLHRLAVPQAVVAGGIEGELAPLNGPRAALRRRRARRGLLAVHAGPAQHGLDPLDEQALAERLVDIVVGPEVEAQDLVDLLVLGGEDDHRQVGGPAQAAQHLHAVHPGHLDVQYGQVGRIVLQRRQAGGAVVVGLHGMAVAFQGQADRRHDVLVVVHQGDLGH